MSAPIHRLTTLRRPVFLVNSRLDLFTAALLQGHSFFRRYRANLPSSLERVISLPLVYSTHVPVSVYGTGAILSKSISFSWKKWSDKQFVRPPAKVANFFRFICSSLRTNKITVKEYKPSFHRLRLSASP